MQPNHGETTQEYAARLLGKSPDCEFGESRDDWIMEHIIRTTGNKRLIEKALKNENAQWTLTRFLAEAANMEDISAHMKQMSQVQPNLNSMSGQQVNKLNVNYTRKPKTPRARNAKQRQPAKTAQSGKRKPNNTCRNCGGDWPHKDTPCRASGKTCRACGRKNHFAEYCRSKQANAVSASPACEDSDSDL